SEKSQANWANKKARFGYCEACNVKMSTKIAVINHFLSEEHAEKVRALGAGAYWLAVSNWMSMIKQCEINVRKGKKM
ncbi:hypothetical protein PMAYCL1PPCAC_14540, partial [Pristionchus mayeri]